VATFGELLRRRREAAGLTRRDLAAASGVPFGTLRQYEDGRRSPSFANAVRLARALGLGLDTFAGCVPGDPHPTHPESPP
jgi:transcriptional regulator with XRE-family HTH domain